ncbi:hypothetical protein MMC20_003450 [Loxospora ochrophaea]|nr:hypothetical protein [Loxospora ochrophaea]
MLWLWDHHWPELIHPFAAAIDTELSNPEEMVCVLGKSKPTWVRWPEGKKLIHEAYGDDSIEGLAVSKVSPNHRPFSLTDPNISFPYTLHEKISTSTLFLVSLVAPALIILLVCLLFVPGSTSKPTPKSLTWRLKLWEWNTNWMGLALALATAFLLIDSMKSLFGKPRPDLLSRCVPNLANAQNYSIGGISSQDAQDLVLVSWQICQQPDLSILNDGFASFPSGHSCYSWAGLGYLTLFLCSKFAIAIPYVLPHSNTTPFSSSSSPSSKNSPSPLPLRTLAASPPIYLLVLAFIPPATAIYVCSTRYSDFRHHGFDILFGALMGMLLAWGSFRWFHPAIRQGRGWSWGPRSAGRAWMGWDRYAMEDDKAREEEIGRDRGEERELDDMRDGGERV